MSLAILKFSPYLSASDIVLSFWWM